MKSEQYLRIADIIAESSHCGRRKVGAVLVKEGRIISTGYNGIPSKLKDECFNLRKEKLKDENYAFNKKLNCVGCEHVIHSEQNAIFAAAKVGISLEGSTLYVNLSPCINCAKAIAMAGISKVIYKNSYKGDPGVPYLIALGVAVERSDS